MQGLASFDRHKLTRLMGTLLRRVAEQRPFEPQTYLALAQSLADLGQTDLALVYFEIAVGGQWDARYADFQKIASFDFARLLRRVAAKELSSSIPDYAAARRESLVGVSEHDLVITLIWNTDRTDVDLYVNEPSGEVCYYGHRSTAQGGQLTTDIRQGNGAEMYTLRSAAAGPYGVAARYFAADANRVTTRTRALVTVYENFGTPRETASRHFVKLNGAGVREDVVTVKVAK